MWRLGRGNCAPALQKALVRNSLTSRANLRVLILTLPSISEVDPGDGALDERGPDSFGDRIVRIASAVPGFTWRASSSESGLAIGIGGSLTMEEAAGLWKRVSEVLERERRFARVSVDLSQVESLDGSCLALLEHMRGELAKRR